MGGDVRLWIGRLQHRGEQPDRLRRLFLLCRGVRQTVGAVRPAVHRWWADFDKSGRVDFGDLAFFAPNFGKTRADVQSGAQTLVFPSNFPAPGARQWEGVGRGGQR
jgi:hypothetical protein